MNDTEHANAEAAASTTHKGWIAYFAGNPIAANLLMLVGRHHFVGLVHSLHPTVPDMMVEGANE